MLSYQSLYNRHSGSWTLVVFGLTAAAVWYSGAATSMPIPPEPIILLVGAAATVIFNNLSDHGAGHPSRQGGASSE